jgi:D-alanyl-lipoteichoic acid acyltransferase DltB (MBOAT superfamily)
LKIILPVGISFYTFHGLSYVLDIYNGKTKPTRNMVDYSLFVSFFPLLVAGPIERATHLLPQLQRPRYFSYEKAVSGLRQILWGLFKKIVVADNCATIVNTVFAHHGEVHASTLVLGAVLFSFQLYGDFSGYTDIALGSARLLGIDLLKNFNFPYFSRDIAEFWRRWHISLATWFRDYLYIPLGGSRVSKAKTIRNTFIVFLLIGFWHGANWTFIVWGLLYALLFMPLLLLGKSRNNTGVVAAGRRLPSLKELFQMLLTFALVTLTRIVFRAETIGVAFQYIKNLFSRSLFQSPGFRIIAWADIIRAIVSILLLLAVEWVNREKDFGLAVSWKSPVLRWAFYVLWVWMIASIGGGQKEFIYFQF